MLNRYLLDSSEDLEKNSPTPEECKEEVNHQHTKIRILLWIAPIITSIAETSEVGVEIETIQNQKILQLIAPNTVACGIIIGSYFLQTLAMNGPATLRGLDQTYQIIKTRKLPDDWPGLSPSRERVAISFTALCTSYAAFADCIASVYFITDLGYNNYLAYSVGAAAALTNIFCEGFNVYETTRNLFSNKPRYYKNSFSRYLTPIIGFPLALGNGMQDIIWSYAPIAALFNLQTNAEKCGIFAASIANGLSDMCFNGGINLETLDNVFGELFNGQCPSPKKLFAASLAMMWASIPADLLRRQTLSFLLSSATTLPMPLIPEVIETLAWLGAMSTGMSFAKSTYQHIFTVTEIMQRFFLQLFHACYAACKKKTEPIESEKKADQPSPTHSKNRYPLFTPRSTSPEPEPALRTSCCTRIMNFFRR